MVSVTSRVKYTHVRNLSLCVFSAAIKLMQFVQEVQSFIISAKRRIYRVLISSGTALDKRKLHQLKFLSDYGAT
jgi:hypothetical protein